MVLLWYYQTIKGKLKVINGMKDIAKRVKEVIDGVGMSPNSFATLVGVDPSNLAKMLKGEQKISAKTIAKISKATGVSEEWITTGEGTKNATIKSSRSDGVPYYGETEFFAAGELAGTGASILQRDAADFIKLPALPNSDIDMAITAHGRSMIDTVHPEQSIPDGAYVVIRPWKEHHIEWGEIYCIGTRDGYAIKRLQPCDDETIYCVSSNEAEGYAPYKVAFADITSISKVKAIINLQLL